MLAAALGTAICSALPSLAIAETGGECFEELSVGEYINLFAPGVYGMLDEDMKALLASSPMYSNPVTPREGLVQNLWVEAWNSSSGAVSYSFSFTCSRVCPTLYALVTITNLSTGVSREQEYWGYSTDKLSKSNTLYGFPSGSYRVVVTAFSPNPPVGMSSYYSQDWDNVTV